MTATRTYSCAEATEIARLATIAVAEVESECEFWADLDGENGERWFAVSWSSPAATKANLLALLSMFGPSCPCSCNRHKNPFAVHLCRMVTVADVLLGRGQDCGAPSPNPQP